MFRTRKQILMLCLIPSALNYFPQTKGLFFSFLKENAICTIKKYTTPTSWPLLSFFFFFFFFFKENSTYELHNNYLKSPKSYHNSKALYGITHNGTKGTFKYDPVFHASVIHIKLRTNKNVLLRSFI